MGSTRTLFRYACCWTPLNIKNYADVWCGTPRGQRQTVIVDTGSGITAFPCQECRHKCGVPQYHLDQLYNGKLSTTFRTLGCDECLNGNCFFFWNRQCSLSRMYAEGSSWRATEVADQCYVGGYHASPIDDSNVATATGRMDPFDPLAARSFELKFGCQTSITGLFVEQLADGIMGMTLDRTSFWMQMHTARKIDRKAFALCMGRSSTIETPVGVMSFGGTNTLLHDITPMVFAKMNPSSVGFYMIKIRAMYLVMPDNSTPMKLADIGVLEEVIVDSGRLLESMIHKSLSDLFLWLPRNACRHYGFVLFENDCGKF
jgi:Xylanase inhibitor N-terminal